MSSSAPPGPSTPLNPECCYCGKSARTVCSGCREAVDTNDFPTWYCTTECQKLDWNTHKSLCKFVQTRNALYKCASVFEEAYGFNANMIAADCSVGFYKGELKVHKKQKLTQSVSFEKLVKFPKGTKDEEVDPRVLAEHWISLVAAANMHALIKNALIRRGIAHKVTELVSEVIRFNVLLKDTSLVVHVPKPVELKYVILKIELESGGEDYALDFYGAALGKGKLLSPLSQHINERFPWSVEAGGRTYLGPFRELAMKIDWDKYEGAFDGYTSSDKNCYWQKYLKEGLRLWKEKGTTLKAMLRLPVAEIRAQKRKLAASLARTSLEYAASKKAEAYAAVDAEYEKTMGPQKM